MKKLLSLSLVASATILSLNAGAQDLSEAIKGVDISGTIAYRYNDYEDNAIDDDTTTSGTNEKNSAANLYKIAVNVKAPVNDDVTANTRFIIGDGTGEAALGTSNTGDTNVAVTLSEVNFTYTGIENATVTVGKQGVATPFTVHRDAMGGESTGTGILATYAMGPVTAAAAYFNQTNIGDLKGTNLATIGVMGSFGPVNAEAWYLDVDNTLNSYTVAADASFDLGGASVEPFIRYSSIDNDDSTAANDDVATLKLGVNAAVGMFDAFLGYGETDKDGGVDIDGNASDTAFDEHWRIALTDQKDSDILFAAVGAQVTDTVHVALKHTALGTPSGTADQDETYVQVSYQMSSNFSTYVRFGELDVDGEDSSTMGRLHVQYSF